MVLVVLAAQNEKKKLAGKKKQRKMRWHNEIITFWKALPEGALNTN